MGKEVRIRSLHKPGKPQPLLPIGPSCQSATAQHCPCNCRPPTHLRCRARCRRSADCLLQARWPGHAVGGRCCAAARRRCNADGGRGVGGNGPRGMGCTSTAAMSKAGRRPGKRCTLTSTPGKEQRTWQANSYDQHRQPTCAAYPCRPAPRRKGHQTAGGRSAPGPADQLGRTDKHDSRAPSNECLDLHSEPHMHVLPPHSA